MKHKRFTMIELLAVMVISILILGIGLPAFYRLAKGSAVEGASRMLGRQLLVTKNLAMAKRRRVAVLLPSDTGPEEMHYRAMAVAYVALGRQFQDTIPNTQITWFPVGALVADIGSGNDSATYQVVHNVDWAKYGYPGVPASDCRAVIFRLTGQLDDYTHRYVTISEGSMLGGEFVAENTGNSFTCDVDGFTGRVSWRDQVDAIELEKMKVIDERK